jgi:hypothetical protein
MGVIGMSASKKELNKDVHETLEKLSQPTMGGEELPLELVEYEAKEGTFLILGGDEGPKVELRFGDEEPWFTQAQMASFFDKDLRTINEHIQTFIGNEELDASTIRDFRIVQMEGKRQVSRTIKHYNLDVAIYVGYRVNSKAGTMFRRWATTILKRFAKHGYVVDTQRLKEPDGYSRVKELREIIKDIRASEANVYREVRELCTMCSDYEPKSKGWQQFFARMQTKLFWATIQSVPTQLRLDRANAQSENMGLTTWSGNRLIQRDTLVAKNYLAQDEVERMNRLSVMLLDFIDDQLKEGRISTMAEMETELNGFIKQTKRPLLPNRGIKIPTKTQADNYCKKQYKIFKEERSKLEIEPELEIKKEN